VKSLETPDHLNKIVPYLFFSKHFFGLLLFVYYLQQIAAVCVLHHYTETVRAVLEKRLLVTYYVRVLNRRQNADLVESVRLFLLAKFFHFYFLHCVNGVVRFADDLVNC
jgi:hypothetical protein